MRFHDIATGSQCGVFVPVAANEGNREADLDILSRATKDHMQWNVRVHVDYGAEGWLVQGGTLVKPNMVLTCEYGEGVEPLVKMIACEQENHPRRSMCVGVCAARTCTRVFFSSPGPQDL